jgi:hypothetical protein
VNDTALKNVPCSPPPCFEVVFLYLIVMKTINVFYGFCVKSTVINNVGNVEVHMIDDEFVQYWGIPTIAYKLV